MFLFAYQEIHSSLTSEKWTLCSTYVWILEQILVDNDCQIPEKKNILSMCTELMFLLDKKHDKLVVFGRP